MPPVTIDISKPCALWPDIDAPLTRAIHETLSHFDLPQTELSLALTDDAQIQTLNKQYRGKDKPTNVLSFPQDDPSLLGDVILAYETVAREAAEQNKDFVDHAVHLTVHGTLHLLGMDHEVDKDAEEMEALEIRILSALNVKNPYES